jgi:hypothetical protein
MAGSVDTQISPFNGGCPLNTCANEPQARFHAVSKTKGILSRGSRIIGNIRIMRLRASSNLSCCGLLGWRRLSVFFWFVFGGSIGGIFWAYDGTPSLCAPPRLYNQVAAVIAEQMGTSRDPLELARLMALVHVAMADAGIAIWESKYHYQVGPGTVIREADPAAAGDVIFTPLGAPASNLAGPNFTPPFPAYPSGHAGFGGALFQILRRFTARTRSPSLSPPTSTTA